MHRRDFLRNTTAATVAATSSPILLGMTDKADSKPVLVGKGDFTYECIHDWGRLPDTIKWQTTHGVAIDSEGLIYVTHMGYGKDVMDTVVVFDPNDRNILDAVALLLRERQ